MDKLANELVLEFRAAEREPVELSLPLERLEDHGVRAFADLLTEGWWYVAELWAPCYPANRFADLRGADELDQQAAGLFLIVR